MILCAYEDLFGEFINERATNTIQSPFHLFLLVIISVFNRCNLSRFPSHHHKLFLFCIQSRYG